MRRPASAITFVASLIPCLAWASEFEPVANTPDPNPIHALDDLTFLDESQWVEAVSRRRQPIAMAPQSVTVLDAEDLALSPAVSIPDRLR
nr:hypothetical protein [Planctomycetota bacterium]